jgi:hypothetical protein
MPTPKYTIEQLEEKRRQGTLTQEDKVDYLVQIRGMLRSDAEHIAYAKYKNEVQISERGGEAQA